MRAGRRLAIALEHDHHAFAALVEVDESGATAAAVEDVTIDGVVAEIGLAAGEPAKRRRIPLEDAVPPAEPPDILRRARPQRVGVARPSSSQR
jgi:hypothetical protein